MAVTVTTSSLSFFFLTVTVRFFFLTPALVHVAYASFLSLQPRFMDKRGMGV